ncbi:hypothetical protein QFZ43_000211 [Streptomyces afghaniensis]|nr:hypothetical protein [Streptomyces afghaniensis]
MPKRVDHPQRRAHITDALNRVQYYFETKAHLLHAALESLGAAEPPAVVAPAGRPAAPSDRARLHRGVPRRGTAHRRCQPGLPAGGDLVRGARDDRPRTGRAALRRRARPPGEAADRRTGAGSAGGHRGPAARCGSGAAPLLPLRHGLGTSVLVGRRSAHAATGILRAHLDQLFQSPARPLPSPDTAAGRAGCPSRQKQGRAALTRIAAGSWTAALLLFAVAGNWAVLLLVWCRSWAERSNLEGQPLWAAQPRRTAVAPTDRVTTP